MTKYKTSEGEEIKEGDWLSYITSSSMSTMFVIEVNGELYGEGPFNTHPLSEYFNALDFEQMHHYYPESDPNEENACFI